MKVNLIIRVEASDDAEQFVETKFKSIETDTLLANKKAELLAPVICVYVETFKEEAK